MRGARRTPPKNHPIMLKIDNEWGDLTFSPSVCHASAGDTIIWSCENRFCLEFDKTPIGEQVVNSEIDPKREDHVAIRQVAKDATRGLYTYRVTIFANRRVYRDAACPDIIIQ